MSRELKFRAWDGKQFTYWGFIEPGVFASPPSSSNQKGMFHIEQMQMTGLKDKNGVEIYEGDIVASGRFKEGVVKYDDCGGGGPDEGFRTMGFYIEDRIFDKGLLDVEPIEVIGNIHQNPELLK